MRACHGDEPLVVDQPGERLRPVQHRQALLLGEDVFGVVQPEGAGDDERVRIADVGCVMADRDRCTQVAQGVDVRRIAHIGAGHGVPRLEEQARDSAHPRSADAHEVQSAELVGDGHGQVGLDHV